MRVSTARSLRKDRNDQHTNRNRIETDRPMTRPFGRNRQLRRNSQGPCTTIAGGSGLPQLTVFTFTSSLQDQLECTRNSQACRPTRHSTGFIFVAKEPVRLPIHYSSNVVVVTLTPRARHDLTETTRFMTRRGSDDLLSVNNTTTLCPSRSLLYPTLPFIFVFIHLGKSPYPLQ